MKILKSGLLAGVFALGAAGCSPQLAENEQTGPEQPVWPKKGHIFGTAIAEDRNQITFTFGRYYAHYDFNNDMLYAGPFAGADVNGKYGVLDVSRGFFPGAVAKSLADESSLSQNERLFKEMGRNWLKSGEDKVQPANGQSVEAPLVKMAPSV